MIIVYILIALFVAWIWVDYFRLIDIFEKNNLLYVALVFALGAGSVYIVLAVQQYIIDPMRWDLNGNFFNDFLYSVFGIGLVEEIAKITPFLILHTLFRKRLKEPIDYLAFVCVSALGFSAAENVMYFQNYGSHLIISRSILCSVSHMFDTALLGYGFILLRFHPKVNNPLLIFVFLFLAALSHGIYDFWLLYNGFSYGMVITLLFFFLTISIFATIINNALNNSAHFTYKKAIDSDFLTKRMFIYYAIVFGIQFILIAGEEGVAVGVVNMVIALAFSGVIVSVSILRLSRFTLIEGRWNKIKLEFPFHIRNSGDKSDPGFRPLGFRIKGPTQNEAYLAKLFEEYVHLMPMQRKGGHGNMKLGYIEKKIFVGKDQAHYIVRLYATTSKNSSYETILIKPKSGRNAHTKSKHPIVARMNVIEIPHPTKKGQMKKKYRFVEWVYVRKAT